MINKNQCLADGVLADSMLPRINELCKRYEVRQLALFGSALRRDFNSQSDVDVAVVFERRGFEGSFGRYMGLKEALEELFQRPVDLVSVDCLRNSVFAEEVERTQAVIYAAWETEVLTDLQLACDDIKEFCRGKKYEQFVGDRLLQAGVERELEIIGEALNRLYRSEPEWLEANISHYRRIIGLRNIIAHGYDVVDNAVLWDVVQNHVPALRDELSSFLWKELTNRKFSG